VFERRHYRLLDRAIAIVACGPYYWVFYTDVRDGIPNLVSALLVANLILWIGTMTMRRSPERVTERRLYWVLAFVATYWPFLVLEILDTGRPIVAIWLSDAISIVGALIACYARISLGRNVGIVPAQRKLVARGAYRFVRHPIYSGIFVLLIASALRSYSFINATTIVIGIALYMLKSVAEERFLSEGSAEYRAYKVAVPWRWVPGVL
jgi:protein-S-isoprenylcysteine O-methyltransferase Ste14